MRTDIHRPSAPEFDPQAYELVGVWDLYPDFGNEGETKNRKETVARYVDQGYKFGEAGEGCGHCGANIRYGALMIRPDVMEMIYVGQQCLTNRFEQLTKAEFTKLREKARLNKDRVNKKEKRAQSIANSVEIQELLAYEQEVEAVGQFLFSLLLQLDDKGELSEKQIAAIRPAIERERKWDAIAKQREVEKQVLLDKGIKAPSGKVSVTGKVLSQKFVENDFGGNVKMLVEAEEGYKVWLTRPSSIFNTEVGDKIQFTANLTPSVQDQLFAIGKNPSKAVILVEAPVEGRAIVIKETI